MNLSHFFIFEDKFNFFHLFEMNLSMFYTFKNKNDYLSNNFFVKFMM